MWIKEGTNNDSDRGDSAGFLWAHKNVMSIVSPDGERVPVADVRKPTEPIAQRSATPGRLIRALRQEDSYGDI